MQFPDLPRWQLFGVSRSRNSQVRISTSQKKACQIWFTYLLMARCLWAVSTAFLRRKTCVTYYHGDFIGSFQPLRVLVVRPSFNSTGACACHNDRNNNRDAIFLASPFFSHVRRSSKRLIIPLSRDTANKKRRTKHRQQEESELVRVNEFKKNSVILLLPRRTTTIYTSLGS